MGAAPEIFVGRRREIESLQNALDLARRGQKRIALLAGEPGIGKTRIARELSHYAGECGVQVLWGNCHEEAGAPPYWPWTQMLRALAASRTDEDLRGELGVGAGEIADLLPDVRSRLPDLGRAPALSDPSGTRFRLFGSIVGFLANASRRRALALVLDDLHWADIASLRLLEFVAQDIAESRLLILGAYRETELSRTHRLSDTLGALARAPHVDRIHLTGLDADDVGRFVSATAGVTPPAWLTSAIHDQTEGNPLFVREVVRLLIADGRFAGPALDGASRRIRLPEGVKEVIGRRLNLLSPACNEVLATGAVIGRNFGFEVLARACRPVTQESVLEALDEAASAHLIEETAPGSHQFTHALVRMTLYDELRTGQRRRLHHAVGEAIEAVYRRDLEPVLVDLAHHFRSAGMAGDAERAIDYTIRAGRSAEAALAFEAGIVLFQNALDTLDSLPADDPARRARLLFLLGDTQRKANDFAAALATLRTAFEIARTCGLHDVQADAAYSYADIAWRTTTHLGARSDILLREALSALPDAEARLRIRLMGCLARDCLHSGKAEEARAVASRAVEMARELGDGAALASSLGALADMPWGPLETEQKLSEAEEMCELAERVNDVEVAFRGHFRRTALLMEIGDMAGAAAAIETVARLNARLRQPFFKPWDLASKATLALLRGALDEAERLILDILRTQTSLKTQIYDPAAMLIFSLRREQLRLRELGAIAASFVRRSADAAVWRPGLALLYLEMGDLEAARSVFQALAAEQFQRLPSDGRLATSLMYLSEVCAALGEAEAASALYRMLSPWTGRTIVMGGGTGCWGAADRFLGLLAAAAQRWETAQAHFDKALAMNTRIGALAPAAHTRVDIADMRLRRGDAQSLALADSSLRAAEEQTGGLDLPLLRSRIADKRKTLSSVANEPRSSDSLTSRELDVLRLLTIGRGNSDIALALEISSSTVATHVHNILNKTGCANRTEAAAYAVRSGLAAR